ncbi:MAG: 3-deoxy-8-phosphooctulonate synthase [Puniceicoccales bacterium]|nr:3-deoxy-8-phosphooctulonate synthase [Puniceicoccales bacterium]
MEKFLLIAGPCLLEGRDLGERVARTLVEVCGKHKDLRLIFKASVDKANRSSFRSARGIGIAAALEALDHIKKTFSVEVTSDFHEPAQAESLAEVCDVLQVPAFLCRQTDMLAAAAATGRAVSVKKGQFLSPWDMANVVGKLRQFGAKEIIQIERGTSFGYGNLVVDMRSFPIMAKNGCRTVFDATHSLQMPGLGGETTAGDRSWYDTLAHAAIGAGADGLFLETHPNPAKALCDSATQLPLDSIGERLERHMQLWRTAKAIGN